MEANQTKELRCPVIDLHTCVQGEGSLSGVPHILIRTSGCNLRCIFDNSICDTPYSSFNPERDMYSWDDIDRLIVTNFQIKNLLITGGEPTLHPSALEKILSKYVHHITIETNGTCNLSPGLMRRVDLISISPKLKTSIPTESKCFDFGMAYSKELEDRHRHKIDNAIDDIVNWILSARDFQLKYVISQELDLNEIFEQVAQIEKRVGRIDKRKIYLMPSGTTDENLQTKRIFCMQKAQELGYSYTDRLQIVVYGNRRDV